MWVRYEAEKPTLHIYDWVWHCIDNCKDGATALCGMRTYISYAAAIVPVGELTCSDCIRAIADNARELERQYDRSRRYEVKTMGSEKYENKLPYKRRKKKN